MKSKIIAIVLTFTVFCTLFIVGCRKKPEQQESIDVPDTPISSHSQSDTTSTSACNHKVVVDPAKHATFSKSGLTEGSHCSICGEVIKKQNVIPALGGDLVVGTDYYDSKGKTTYRYSYSFSLYDNDRFNLTTLKVGSDESYELTGEDGKFNYLDNGVYELIFDSKKEKMYAKIVNGQFEFCNKEGSSLDNGKNKRPQGTTKVDITPRAGNSVHGYYDLANNKHGTSMQELYYRMYASCEAFVNSKKDVKSQNGSYTIDKISLDYYVLTTDEAAAVWKVFIVENPRYYWLANTASLSDGMLIINIDPAYAKSSYRQTCDAAINTMSKSCSTQLKSGMGQLQKALTIHDFVLGQMNYAYKSDGKTPQDAIWAHNLMGSAEKKSGVCEAYAKTYQYLCRLNGLDCIIATGFNRENHAWNVISIDGKWYGVDCTFDETNTKDVSYHCFGMSAARMAQDYQFDTPHDNGIKYLYETPDLSSQSIELVDLYKNGKILGTYANVDAAFAAMTDSAAEYEIQLQLYKKQGVLLLSTSTVAHHVYATQSPTVKKLTIRGRHIDLGNGYYNSVSLYIEKKLTLRSDLAIYDLDVRGNGALNIAGNKVQCLGTSDRFYISVTGNTDSKDPSEIEVGELDSLEFCSTVKIHTYRHEYDDCYMVATFRKDTDIVDLRTYRISVYDTKSEHIKVNIQNVYPVKTDGYCDITVTGAAKINVNKIHTTTESSRIYLRFGKKAEMPILTLGTFNNSYFTVYFDGRINYSSTDMSGNEVGKWTESVTPADMKGTLFTLKDASYYNKLHISISTANRSDDVNNHSNPEKFKLNSQNQVVFTP